MKTQKLLIPFVLIGGEKGGSQCIRNAYPQLHVRAFQVYLAELDQAKPGVRRQYVLYREIQCPPEAHRLLGGLYSDSYIEATPR